MMQDMIVESNMASVTGRIASEFRKAHWGRGEELYMVDVLVVRLSGLTDRIPLVVQARLVHIGDCIGRMVSVEGQFRSYNRHEGGRSQLVLSVFAREFRLLEDGESIDYARNNRIFLDGHICKKPIHRRTPKGKDIADMLLAVNRAHGKSDYIPCIVWGKDAKDVARLEVGAAVRILGRIQSREYEKKLPQGESEIRVAYEVSAMEVEADDARRREPRHLHRKEGRWD